MAKAKHPPTAKSQLLDPRNGIVLHLAELPDVGPYGLLGFGFMKHIAEKNSGQQKNMILEESSPI